MLFPEPQAGQYSDSHAYFLSRMNALARPPLLADGFDGGYLNRFSECAWTFVAGHLSSEDARAFEAHSRGQENMKATVFSRVAEVFDRIFISKTPSDKFEALIPYCPDVVNEFRAKEQSQ
jgi:hypothetical protein